MAITAPTITEAAGYLGADETNTNFILKYEGKAKEFEDYFSHLDTLEADLKLAFLDQFENYYRGLQNVESITDIDVSYSFFDNIDYNTSWGKIYSKYKGSLSGGIKVHKFA